MPEFKEYVGGSKKNSVNLLKRWGNIWWVLNFRSKLVAVGRNQHKIKLVLYADACTTQAFYLK